MFPVRYFPARVFAQRIPGIVAPELWRWVGRHAQHFDVAHVHLAREPVPLLCCLLLKRLGVPYFVQTHGMLNTYGRLKNLFDRVILKRVLEGAASVLALQHHELERLREIAPGANIVTLPNGLSEREIHPRWSLDQLAIEPPTVLFLARLHARKRVLDFVECARLLTERGVDARFRVVGPDGGEAGKVREAVERFGLTDRVEIFGALPRERCYEEFAAAAVHVLPSVDEPFPMSVLEALTVGVPTIVTEGIHIRDLLESHDAAEVTAARPEALADAVTRLLHDGERARQLSENGRRLIREHLEMDGLAKRLIKIYRGQTYGSGANQHH